MKKRILNIGCGDQTYGTDFVDLQPSRHEVEQCNVDEDELPYPDETFDEVYSRFNLEHLRRHKHFFNEAYRVLKRKGKLKLITDNANYWLWSVCKTHHGDNLLGDEDTPHYSLFVPEHLLNHFKKTGFGDIGWSLMDVEGDPLYIKLINQFLRLTPFRRMSYHAIKIRGVKE